MTKVRSLELPELAREDQAPRVLLHPKIDGWYADLIMDEPGPQSSFRGSGATEAAALEDLAATLMRTAAAIRRQHGGTPPMEEWFALAERVFMIASSEAHDESKYDLIFTDGLHRRLSEIRYLEYGDPDGSYAEDVAAYVAALQRQYDDLRKVRHAFTERR